MLNPTIPFPQADRLERVIDLIDALSQGILSLVDRYGFSERQADYYLNAARYLGFVDGAQELTPSGKLFVQSRRHARHIQMLQAMVQRPVLRQGIEFMEKFGELPSTHNIQEWLTQFTDLRRSTLGRRARTVNSWLGWIRIHFLDVLFVV